MNGFATRLALLLFIFSGIILNSWAQSKYYVSTSGNDLNSGTSIGSPFATLAKAITVAIVPGDSIFVRSGTYTVGSTMTINKPGTVQKHIVLTAYLPDLGSANDRPVFDFSAMPASSSNRGINLSGANYWDIYGIVIKGAGDNGMNVSASSYTTITFCSFTRNRDTGLQLGGGSHHVTVINCDSYENADLGTGTTTNGGNADGFAPKLDVGDTIIFKGCRAWMNSDDGWDGYLRPANNISVFLEDCWAFRNGYYWLDGSTTSSMNGNGFKLGGSDTKDLAHHFTLVKCLAFQNKKNGFDQNSNAGSIYLYNNTAYSNLGRDYFLTSSSVTYIAGAQLVLFNNISLGSGGVSIPSASTSTRTLITGTNLFSTSATNSDIKSYDTTGVTAMRNPDGSLPTINFMRLNPSAPAPHSYIDMGTVLSNVVYHGVTGIPYLGTAPDLGFDESSDNSLPLNLLSFSGSVNNDEVILKWMTGTNTQLSGWSIERTLQPENKTWSSIGFVQANQSSSQKDYSFADKNVSSGTYYYRLKQMDVDGKIFYSPVLQIKIGSGNQISSISVHPNPFSNATTIDYQLPRQSAGSLKLYNQQGQFIQTLSEGILQPGAYQKWLNGQSLQKGIYYLQFHVADEIVTSKLVKW